ncbi:MAG: hypothetical protein ABIG60_03840 [Patescibacteria group bacterium]
MEKKISKKMKEKVKSLIAFCRKERIPSQFIVRIAEIAKEMMEKDGY